jgi:hypothetical protein
MHLLPPQVELDSTVLILTLATLAITFLICSLLDRWQSTRSAPTQREARRGVSATVVDGIHAR